MLVAEAAVHARSTCVRSLTAVNAFVIVCSVTVPCADTGPVFHFATDHSGPKRTDRQDKTRLFCVCLFLLVGWSVGCSVGCWCVYLFCFHALTLVQI